MKNSSPGERIAHLEVIYEGDHSLPCVYMAEVVEKAVKKFGARIRWEKVELTKRKGAQRYAELSVRNGAVAPVPSLFINGKLAFERVPPLRALKDYLEENFEMT